MCVALEIAVNLRVNVGKNNIESLDELLTFIEEKKWPMVDKLFVS